MPNLIVILFNFLYPIFYAGFLCKGCVWERLWRLKANWKAKKFSWVACERPSRKVKHVLNTWLECKESWQMVIVGLYECLAGKAPVRYPWNILFCQSIISDTPVLYSHYIYPYYPHMLRSDFKEKTLAITLESERLSYPQFSTQFIVVFLNSYLSISKSLRGW